MKNKNNRYQLWSLLFNNTVNLKINKVNYRKKLFQFNLDLINHKITYDAVMKKISAPVVPLFKGHWGNVTALHHPCLPLSAVTVSLHYLLRCLRSISRPIPSCATMSTAALTIFQEWCFRCLLSRFNGGLPLSFFTSEFFRSIATCEKKPNIATWSEHWKIFCHVIVRQ